MKNVAEICEMISKLSSNDYVISAICAEEEINKGCTIAEIDLG